MSDRITTQQFYLSAGVSDWRVLERGAYAYFLTGTFSKGLTLVNEIGRLAEELNHHPDIDLRYASVTVRLWSHDSDSLSQRDVALARAISLRASELHCRSDPNAVHNV